MKQPLMLVTGASRGIGAEIAKMAGRSGYKVGVNFHHSEKEAREVVAEIKDNGSDAVALQADAGDSAQVAKMFERFDAELGTLDALVNNAGMLSKFNVSETDIAQLAEDFFGECIQCVLLLARSGATDVDEAGWTRRCDRQYVIGRGAHRRPQRRRRIRGDQGCDGFIHGGAGKGSRHRRHSSQCNSAGIDRHRNSQCSWRTRADGAARESCRAAWAIGLAAGSSGGSAMAGVGRVFIRAWRNHRRLRRTLERERHQLLNTARSQIPRLLLSLFRS